MVNKSYVRVFRYRNKIIDIYYDKNNNRIIDEISEYPFEYFTDTGGAPSDFVDYRTKKIKLDVIRNNSIRKHNESLELFKQSGGKIFSNADPEDQYRFKEYSTDVLNKLHLVYFDIETGFNGTIVLPNGELKRGDGGFPKLDGKTSVTTITAYSAKNNKFYAFGLKDYTPSEDNVIYKKCLSEHTMLIDFFKLINDIGTDALIGWNSDGFDIPFLINRLLRLEYIRYIEYENIDLPELNREELSKIEITVKHIVGKILCKYYKFNKPAKIHSSKNPGNKDLLVLEPLGYYLIDQMSFYKKFRYKIRDSYALNAIAIAEGITGKLNYSEDYLYEIELENGEVLKLLEDDNIKLKDGRIIQVKDLTENDEISDDSL